MRPQKFSWRKRLKSFAYAFAGVKRLFYREHNAWIHAGAAVIALIAAAVLKVSALEMIAILVAIGLVWMAELFNTAIEKIMDHLHPELHPSVKEIKDLAAGAVLVAAVVACLTGCIIFIPKIV